MCHRWLEALREATAGLPEGVRVTRWKGSLFDNEPYVDNYREFRQKRGASVPPLEAPLSLPALPHGIEPGELPTAEQLLQDLAHADCTALHPEVIYLLPLKDLSARTPRSLKQGHLCHVHSASYAN